MSSVSVYRSTTDFPQDLWDVFASHSRDANIIYPHALHTVPQQLPGQFWMVCSTNETIDLVLSCTDGSLGTLPIFIFSPQPLEHLTKDFLQPRLALLSNALLAEIPIERVFSVFALDVVGKRFAKIWSRLTGVSAYLENPYYHANLTHCTRKTFRNRSFTVLPGRTYEMRLANIADLDAVAQLCYGFAEGSEPFTLGMDQARQEASLMINRGQVWVHTMARGGQAEEVASIVAVTRESETVSAITKVYTNPKWRGMKCAERLVRKVTQSLLKKRESVVLYVAHNNLNARKVYDRVGFVGISVEPDAEPIPGINSWIEIGFDTNRVELGHW